MPTVMLAGQKPNRSSKQGRFQIVDVVKLMSPTTQYSKQVVEGNRVPAMVREAFRLAAHERPGAAYLNLPEDIASEDTDASIFEVVEKPPFLMEKSGKKVIHINFHEARIDDIYFPQLNVVGDIADTVHRLAERLGTASKDFSYFDRVRTEVESHTSRYFTDDRFLILPQRLVKLLRDNALATMGAGLPLAMATKQLHADRKVISVNGDGGFLMYSQELETAVRMKLDLVIIVLNDSAYSMIKWKQEGMGFENFGLGFKNPDLVQYATSSGAVGHRADNVECFVKIFDTAFNSKGVHFIDLPVDYSLNHDILNVMIKDHACTL